MARGREKFNFKWKLIENYFNGFLVFSFTFLFAYGLVYRDKLVLMLSVIWGLIAPFIATFLDKKSQQN